MPVQTVPPRSPAAMPSTIRTTVRLTVLLVVVALAIATTATVGAAGSLPPCRVADITTAQRSYSAWDRTVLDTTYRLTSAYRPSDLRSTANAGLNGGHMVRSFVIADLGAMARAARAAGARLAVQSAYRTYSTQRWTFASWSRISGYSAALESSARPGHSEHQLGTTIDFRSYGRSAAWYARDWGASKAGGWLRQNAWKYGFVMSYPKGKTIVTCYRYEPWHYRYVGRPAAAAIRASGLTLREYLWRQESTPLPTPSATPIPSEPPSQPPSEPPSADPSSGPSPTEPSVSQSPGG